ncbi:MAG: hypothetical protein ACOYL0_02585, partial [Limnohabitans sp.]
WQSPSNAHAYRLYIFKDLIGPQNSKDLLFFAPLAAMSEAFDCSTLFCVAFIILSKTLNYF